MFSKTFLSVALGGSAARKDNYIITKFMENTASDDIIQNKNDVISQRPAILRPVLPLTGDGRSANYRHSLVWCPHHSQNICARVNACAGREG